MGNDISYVVIRSVPKDISQLAIGHLWQSLLSDWVSALYASKCLFRSTLPNFRNILNRAHEEWLSTICLLVTMSDRTAHINCLKYLLLALYIVLVFLIFHMFFSHALVFGVLISRVFVLYVLVVFVVDFVAETGRLFVSFVTLSLWDVLTAPQFFFIYCLFQIDNIRDHLGLLFESLSLKSVHIFLQ